MLEQSCTIRTLQCDNSIRILLIGKFLRKSESYLEENIQATLVNTSSDVIFDMRGVEKIGGQCLMVLHKVLSKLYVNRKIAIECRSQSTVESMLLHLGFHPWFGIAEARESLKES